MNRHSDPREELRGELGRLLELLKRHLHSQRHAGRTADTDSLRGMAIEEGEAEQILGELSIDLAKPDWASVDSGSSYSVISSPRDLQETPLRRAKRLFQMGQPEMDALLFALAVEIDSRFARLAAFLNDHIARSRPTIGLSLVLSGATMNAVEFCQRPAVRFGLLQTEGDGPKSCLSLRLPPEMLNHLAAPECVGSLPPGVRLRGDPSFTLDSLIIDPVHRGYLARWSARLSAGQPVPPLLLASPEGGGRGTAVAAAAAAAEYGLVETTWLPECPEILGGAAREALWQQAVLLVRIRDSAGRGDLAGLWIQLSGWNLPLALAIPPGLAELVRATSTMEPVLLTLKPPDIAQRESLWQRLLPTGAVQLTRAELEDLASRYDFLPGQLARAVRSALAHHELIEGEGSLGFEALSSACRAVGSEGMGPVAQRLPLPYQRQHLVLPQELLAELDLARSWMSNRRQVFEDWGFGQRIALGQGLTALFTGAPGTGKTMAAQVLAHELGLDLFRVDLSRVMSKYIGETEKNLSRLFDDARASGAILFFDEADALFGKRTEVKDAHDRYANLEIGYLLQRMEEHVGTTVLATNRMRDLDEAFTRRFHFILNFPLPGPSERLRIWEGMLSPEAQQDQNIDLKQLANSYDISGGEIRNSVVSAAFIAASEGTRIGLRHLKWGLRRELLKTGRVLDMYQRQELEKD